MTGEFVFNPEHDYSQWHVICYVRVSAEEGPKIAEARSILLADQCERSKMHVLESVIDVDEPGEVPKHQQLRTQYEEYRAKMAPVRIITDRPGYFKPQDTLYGTSTMVVPLSIPSEYKLLRYATYACAWGISGQDYQNWRTKACLWIRDMGIAEPVREFRDWNLQRARNLASGSGDIEERVEGDVRQGFRNLLGAAQRDKIDGFVTMGLAWSTSESDRYAEYIKASYGINVVKLPWTALPQR